jgi:hypothetical protein
MTTASLSLHVTAIVSLTRPAVIGPVDKLLGGTPRIWCGSRR